MEEVKERNYDIWNNQTGEFMFSVRAHSFIVEDHYVTFTVQDEKDKEDNLATIVSIINLDKCSFKEVRR